MTPPAMNETEKLMPCQCKNKTPGAIIEVTNMKTMLCPKCGSKVCPTPQEADFEFQRKEATKDKQLRLAREGLERIKVKNCDCHSRTGCGFCLDLCNQIAEETLAKMGEAGK